MAKPRAFFQKREKEAPEEGNPVRQQGPPARLPQTRSNRKASRYFVEVTPDTRAYRAMLMPRSEKEKPAPGRAEGGLPEGGESTAPEAHSQGESCSNLKGIR